MKSTWTLLLAVVIGLLLLALAPASRAAEEFNLKTGTLIVGAGTAIGGLKIAEVVLTGDTTATSTVTGALTTDNVFASPGTNASSTYLKKAYISAAGVLTVTMSGASTGTLQVLILRD
jgi:hypothetical protein